MRYGSRRLAARGHGSGRGGGPRGKGAVGRGGPRGPRRREGPAREGFPRKRSRGGARRDGGPRSPERGAGKARAGTRDARGTGYASLRADRGLREPLAWGRRARRASPRSLRRFSAVRRRRGPGGRRQWDCASRGPPKGTARRDGRATKPRSYHAPRNGDAARRVSHRCEVSSCRTVSLAGPGASCSLPWRPSTPKPRSHPRPVAACAARPGARAACEPTALSGSRAIPATPRGPVSP